MKYVIAGPERRVALAAGFALVLAVAFPASAFTQPGRVDAKERAEKTERNRANTVLFAQALCIAAGGLLVWVAVGIGRRGLGIGPRRWVSKRYSWLLALVIVAIGLAIALVGVLYASGWLAVP